MKKTQAELHRAQSDYRSRLFYAVVEMQSGAVDADKICSLIHDVWHNCIYKVRDTRTDKYTFFYSRFYDDFNIALRNLMADTGSNSIYNLRRSLERNQISVKDSMQKLRNPPKDLENAYSMLLNLSFRQPDILHCQV